MIDVSILEEALRDDLNERAPRATAVLDPLKLIIDNYPEGQFEQCQAPVHPHKPEMGKRVFPFGRELWIEREDFAEAPPKGYFRLFPGNSVRLRYGYVVQCTGCDKDAAGNVVAVHCEYFPDSRSGTPGADAYKLKGNIHWVCAVQALQAEIRLYDRLFKVPFPGSRKGREETTASVEEDDTGKAHVAEEKADYDFLDDINPDSVRVITAYVEPGLKDAAPEDRFQFERHGYFVADLRDSRPGKPVFNRAVTLKDSWGKQGG